MKDEEIMWKVFYLEKNEALIDAYKIATALGTLLRDIYIKTEDEEIRSKIKNAMDEYGI